MDIRWSRWRGTWNLFPNVTALPDGGFAVIYYEEDAAGSNQLNPYTRRFNSDGTPFNGMAPQLVSNGNPYHVDGDSYGPSYEIDIVGLPDGGYVVFWDEKDDANEAMPDLYGRRYGADGLPAGAKFQISDERKAHDIQISAELLSNNSIVVGWSVNPYTEGGDHSGVGVATRIISFTDEAPAGLLSEISISSNDTIVAESGAETLSGGLGNDVYEFGYGDGADVIVNGDSDVANSTDIVKLDAGITADDLWFRQEDNDLVAQVLGTEDQVTLQDWYDASSENYQAIDQFELADGSSLEAINVQALVDAMSAFAPTDIAVNNVEEHEDYNSLQNTIAASWG